MMSDLQLKALLGAYIEAESREPPLFLSSFFGEEKTTRAGEIEVDTQRTTDYEAEDITLAQVEEGNLNEADRFTQKNIEPPLYNEYVAIGAQDLYNRVPGQTPYSAVASGLGSRILDAQLKCRRKVQRKIERQASEVLFSEGVISLRYPIRGAASIDYERRAAMDFDAAAAWSTSTEDAIGDIEDGCDLIVEHGKLEPKTLIAGATAWGWLLENDAFKERLLHVHRSDLYLETPQAKAQGGKFHGRLTVGSYVLDLWTYGNAGSTNPTTDTRTTYVPAASVAIIGERPRLVTGYAGVPASVPVGGVDPSLGGTLPDLVEGRIVPYTAKSQRGLHVFAGVISRPLLIPVAIDSWVTINTNP